MKTPTAPSFRFSIMLKVVINLAILAVFALAMGPKWSDATDMDMEPAETGSYLMQQNHCSRTGLGGGVIPSKAVILRDAQPALVTFDEGWRNRHSVPLLGVCP
jgi:hypothetical protein